MQIICEFCGRAIDTDEEDSCQHCGASYKDNQHYRDVQYMVMEKEKIKHERLKTKAQENDLTQKRKNKSLKLIKTILVIYFLITFGIPFVVGFVIGITEAVQEETYLEETKQLNYVNGLNVWSETDEYSLQVTQVKETEYYSLQPPEGYRYIVVYFYIKNKSSDDLLLSDSNVTLTSNDIAQKLVNSYTLESDISIKPNNILSGYYVYEVPCNCKQFVFQYDEASVQFSSLNIEPLY